MAFESKENYVLIVNADSFVGSDTLKSLLAGGGGVGFPVRVAVTDKSKALEHFKSREIDCKKLELIEMDMSKSEQFKRVLKNVKSVFITPPFTEKRADQVKEFVSECHNTETLKHIVLQSHVAVAVEEAREKSTWGQEFYKMEESLRKNESKKVAYTVVRTPIFLEDLYLMSGSVRQQSKLVCHIRPEAPFPLLSTENCGTACAEILMTPEKHYAQVYTLTCSEIYNWQIISATFTKLLKRRVSYDQVSKEESIKTLESLVPEWYARSLVDFGDYMDKDLFAKCVSHDYKAITGHEPVNLDKWIAAHLDQFQ